MNFAGERALGKACLAAVFLNAAAFFMGVMTAGDLVKRFYTRSVKAEAQHRLTGHNNGSNISSTF
jgi:hypothetical protein